MTFLYGLSTNSNLPQCSPTDSKAITGVLRQPHVIEQQKCIKCGTCVNNCRLHAISLK